MPGGKLPADYMILKRRQQEEHKVFYEGVCKANFKAGANAEWEIRTAGSIAAMKTQKRFDAIRRVDAAALDARRHQLAEMLRTEQMAQEAALTALDVTPAQNKARMEARAKELGDKREAERQEFVRAQYERQWRLACDPLREQESQVRELSLSHYRRCRTAPPLVAGDPTRDQCSARLPDWREDATV
jgi:hypothetical protein